MSCAPLTMPDRIAALNKRIAERTICHSAWESRAHNKDLVCLVLALAPEGTDACLAEGQYDEDDRIGRVSDALGVPEWFTQLSMTIDDAPFHTKASWLGRLQNYARVVAILLTQMTPEKWALAEDLLYVRVRGCAELGCPASALSRLANDAFAHDDADRVGVEPVIRDVLALLEQVALAPTT